jgi:AcrR family transcriptional regulator
MSTEPSPRERLLLTTETMLRESGMAGTGIKEVVARSGSPIGSLYHYFPGGKTQLVIEALERHAERFPRLAARFLDGRKSAATSLREWFDTAADEFEARGAHRGCAVGAVALDVSPTDHEIRRACEVAFDDWTSKIADRLPLRTERDRRSFATTTVAAFEGAFVLSRAMKSGDPFRHAGRWLSLALLAQATPKSERKPVSRSHR